MLICSKIETLLMWFEVLNYKNVTVTQYWLFCTNGQYRVLLSLDIVKLTLKELLMWFEVLNYRNVILLNTGCFVRTASIVYF